MSDYQLWTGTCNLVNDPVHNNLGGTRQVCRFRIASSGPKSDMTLYIDVTCWGEMAAACFKYLTKGDKVLIAGPLKNREWTNESLQKRKSIEVIAHRVVFLKLKQGDRNGFEAQA